MSETKLQLYNTLTRSKEDFVPIDEKNVRMYVCGPTVYDFAHIGNARPAIVFDVLYRLLRHVYGEDHVTYVRNITDVDDKINARALRDFGAEIEAGRLSLNDAIRKVTEPTYDQYQKDITALGCLPPTHQPRATEFVLPRADGRADMLGLIQSLIDRGHAYVAAGEVLFDTGSMEDYGQLSKRPLDEQIAGARVEVDAHKKNPADFVLWKESASDEPGWEASFKLSDANRLALGLNSPTTSIRGRPGWHIECSAMSEAYLGKIFDIHGGGLDLIFPHHENEIAQSRCAHGTPTMANVWMHNGFLQVEGQKMSKSLGNFYAINELLETQAFGGRKWPGEVLRLAMLMTHYREPIDFSVRRLEEAENIIRRWRDALAAHHIANNPHDGPKELPAFVIEALGDDLSFSRAMSGLHELANAARAGDAESAYYLAASADFLGLRRGAWDALDQGLLFKEITDDDFKAAFDAAIATRLAFIAAKDWPSADRIRDELLAQGIQLKDGKDLATGARITTWEVKR